MGVSQTDQKSELVNVPDLSQLTPKMSLGIPKWLWVKSLLLLWAKNISGETPIIA